LVLFLAGGCSASLSPLAGGAVAFGVMGDTPYSEDQARRLDTLIDDLNGQRLEFVAHVGDVGTSAQACRDDWLAARKAQFAKVQHPFVLLPGDNEWSDCHQVGADPLERLRRWRALFCSQAAAGLRLERQAGEHCEHVRWRAGGALFVALNLPGNNNNARMPAEQAARMKAVLEWIDAAERLDPPLLVLLAQANPFVPRRGYDAFLLRLEALARARPGRVVLIHGDTHLYRDDEPRAGLRRIEVWGSPFVSWLRGTLTPAGLHIEPARQY
jgi:hypothetical protein